LFVEHSNRKSDRSSLLLEQAGSSIPTPFLVVMVFWLAVIFTSFGLFAPYNATVTATLFVFALSVQARSS